MRQRNPIIRSKISGNSGYIRDVPVQSGKTYGTNCVVTGGQICVHKTSSMVTALWFLYLSIPIMGRSTLRRADAGVDDLALRCDVFLIGDDLRTRVVSRESR